MNGFNKVTEQIGRNARKWLMGLLVLMSLGNAACSTPAVPDKDADPPETAWWAYQDCMATLPRSMDDSVCDKVGTTAGMSRTRYTGTGSSSGSGSGTTSGGNGPYGKALLQDNLSEQLTQSYREYLKTLDPQTLSELTALWQAAVQAEKE